jgi:hypothetical protein
MYFKQLVKEDLGCASHILGCPTAKGSTIASAILQKHGIAEKKALLDYAL